MTQSNNIKLILTNDQSSSPPKEFELIKSEIIIGRDDSADVTIPASAVSRRHARLMLEGENYMLEDLGSSNGTFLNGEKLAGRRSLKPGDKIRLGQTINLEYQAPGSTSEKTAEHSAPGRDAHK